jgi:hypothetical protein
LSTSCCSQGGEALAITLSARTSYLLHAFQPGCAPELVTQVRLHVMGAGMALDRWVDEAKPGNSVTQCQHIVLV